ncbi:MAG: tRNA pseudouridine(38-40) synthase TruA [Candidatus Atribacteria bacterium]|nr:tRNA pseudouridine(38-40) synthase TruA [Candidatus Atribacteria bacterium]
MIGLRNLLLVLEYDGSSYSGWQIQKGKRTVQGVLEAVLSKILEERVRVIASGRTDAGVHAVGQVVNFWTESPLPEEVIFRVLEAHLPEDVRPINLFEVPPDFHARKKVVRKRYTYVVFLEHRLPVFLRNYVYCPGRVDIDIQQIREVSQIFLGTHNFTSFSSPREGNGSAVRTVSTLEVRTKHPFLFFDIEADGFLYHMVRFLVGELLMVGLGRKGVDDLQHMLIHPSYTYRRFHAPPQGLYLVAVEYPGVDPYCGLVLRESGFVVPLWRRIQGVL